MKQRVVFSVLSMLIIAILVSCGPPENAVATDVAQVEATEKAIAQETQTAEALIFEQTKSAEETKQAVFTQETEQAQFARETEQAVRAQAKTIQAQFTAQTQTTIPR